MTGVWSFAPLVHSGPVWQKFCAEHELERWGLPVALLAEGDVDQPDTGRLNVYLATDPPLSLNAASPGLLGLGDRATRDWAPIDHTTGWAPVPATDVVTASRWVRAELGDPTVTPAPDREQLIGELGVPDHDVERMRFRRPDPGAVVLVADRLEETVTQPDQVIAWLDLLRTELVGPLLRANEHPGVSLGYNPGRQGGIPYGLGASIVTETMAGRWGRTKPDDRGWRAIASRLLRHEIRSVHVNLDRIDGRGWTSTVHGGAHFSLHLDDAESSAAQVMPRSIVALYVSDDLAEGIGRLDAQRRLLAVGLNWAETFGATSGFAAWTRESGLTLAHRPSPWERELDWGFWRPDPTSHLRGAHWGTLIPDHLAASVDIAALGRLGVTLSPLRQGLWIQVGVDARELDDDVIRHLEDMLRPALPDVRRPG